MDLGPQRPSSPLPPGSPSGVQPTSSTHASGHRVTPVGHGGTPPCGLKAAPPRLPPAFVACGGCRIFSTGTCSASHRLSQTPGFYTIRTAGNSCTTERKWQKPGRQCRSPRAPRQEVRGCGAERGLGGRDGDGAPGAVGAGSAGRLNPTEHCWGHPRGGISLPFSPFL